MVTLLAIVSRVKPCLRSSTLTNPFEALTKPSLSPCMGLSSVACTDDIPSRRTCAKWFSDLKTKRSELPGHMTVQQGVHMLKSLLGLMWGGTLVCYL
jgi:hypothetical protein